MPTDAEIVFLRNAEFGRAWTAANPPDLWGFLADLAEPLRGEVFAHLLTKDLTLRETAGLPVDAGHYRVAFPTYGPIIDRAFRDRSSPEPPADPTRPLPQFGRFETVSCLGAGGQGRVYLVRDPASGERFAVKAIAAGAHAIPAARARFRAEAELAARLRHPGVAAVCEIDERAETPFIRMEFVDGASLQELYQHRRPPAAEAAAVVADLADILAAAHLDGVVHRDVKPSNVLVATANGQVKLVDFGAARDLLLDRNLTSTAATIGTAGYMAPEQVGGSGRATALCDVFALGGVLYFLLTGRPPVPGILPDGQGNTERPRMLAPAEVVPSVDPTLEAICLKCLLRDPAARYPSAMAVYEDLEAYQEGRPLPHLLTAGAGPGGAAATSPTPTPPKPTVADRAVSAAYCGGTMGVIYAVGPVERLNAALKLTEPFTTIEGWKNAILGVVTLGYWKSLSVIGQTAIVVLIMATVGWFLSPTGFSRRNRLAAWVRRRYETGDRSPRLRRVAAVHAVVTFGRWLAVGLALALVANQVMGFADFDAVVAGWRWVAAAGLAAAAGAGFALGLPPSVGGMWVRSRPGEWLVWCGVRAAGWTVLAVGVAVYGYVMAARACEALGGRLSGTAWAWAEVAGWAAAVLATHRRLTVYRPEAVALRSVPTTEDGLPTRVSTGIYYAVTFAVPMVPALAGVWWLHAWVDRGLSSVGVAPPGPVALGLAATVLATWVGFGVIAAQRK